MPKYVYAILTIVGLIILLVPQLFTVYHVPGFGFLDFVKVGLRVLFLEDGFASPTGDYYG